MRAAVFHGRGDVRVEERPRPEVDGEGTALVAVTRAALCGTDVAEFASGPHLVTRPPTVLGHEFVGVVVSGTARVAAGTRVVSGAGVSCGRCRRCAEGRTNLCLRYETLGLTRDGGLADLVAVPDRTLVPVPDPLGDDVAVLAQPLAVGLHAVRRAAPAADDIVVLLGAGAIGTFALLGLVDAPHGRIVVVDCSDAALAQARVNAPDAVTCRPDEVRDLVRDLSGGRGADLVLETSGAAGSLAAALAITARGGRVQAVGLPVEPQTIDVSAVVLAEIDIRTSVAHVCDEDVPQALDLLSRRAPALRTTEVDLEDVVGSALRPLSEGERLGKVLVRVG